MFSLTYFRSVLHTTLLLLLQTKERKEKEKIDIEIAVLFQSYNCVDFYIQQPVQRRTASVKNNMIGASAAQQ